MTIGYPGASAQVIADTVAAPIEQQVNGVEGMLYMSSQMGNDGSYSLSVTFDVGTDLGSPVSFDYFERAPFAFNGKIEKVEVSLE